MCINVMSIFGGRNKKYLNASGALIWSYWPAPVSGDYRYTNGSSTGMECFVISTMKVPFLNCVLQFASEELKPNMIEKPIGILLSYDTQLCE